MRALVVSLVLFAACGGGDSAVGPPCFTDADCKAEQVCFPNGCGDPGAGLVVEVTANLQTGFYPQDFSIDPAALSASMPFEVAGPLVVVGSVQREPETSGNPVPYVDGLTLRASGTSLLIPGVQRSYEVTMSTLDLSVYQLPIGTGQYTMTAIAADADAYPPQTFDSIVVAGVLGPADAGLTSDGGAADSGAYEAPVASFVFPSNISCITIFGTLAKDSPGGTPIFIDAPMTVQAFDPSTNLALSQSATVSRTNGQFRLFIDPSAASLDSISLVSSSKDGTSLVPSNTFVIPSTSYANLVQPYGMTVLQPSFETGDYGAGLPQVPGTLVGTDGHPISGATIVVAGKVAGGGTFRSQQVISGADGGFAVDLLASDSDTGFVLSAYPPANNPSGILQLSIGAAAVGTMPTFVPNTPMVCPDRIAVTGTLLRPTGDAAAGATVTATAISAINNQPLPLAVATVVTDADGVYRLFLDPATYRLDYFPGETLPQKARIISVQRDIDVDAGALVSTIDLGSFPLSLGRTITGSITTRAPTDEPGTGTTAPNALVRYFRVTSVEGTASALLLGQAIADTNGNYSIVLPDHPAAR